jgi:cytosolic carboxypeptidase protein 2/3
MNGINPIWFRSEAIHQGNYRHLAGINNSLKIELQSNCSNTNLDPELWVDNKNDFFGIMEQGLKPFPLRPKVKGSRLRKKSNIREVRITKEKDIPMSSHINKAKMYQNGGTNITSTPINLQEKVKNYNVHTPLSSLSVGKVTSNSFVFMKNNIVMKKTQSYQVNADQQDQEEARTETVKNSGRFNWLWKGGFVWLLLTTGLENGKSNSNTTVTATEKRLNSKDPKKLEKLKITPKIGQNSQKITSKRDMSAVNQRNRVTTELLKLEKSGALNNLPKIWVDTVFQVKRIKFVQNYKEFDKIWFRRGDWKEEYMRKDQLKQNNKFIKSWKTVYDLNEKSPFYTDPNKPYIDDRKLVPLKDNGQFVPHRRFKAAGFRRGLINTGIPLKDKYYLDLNPYYVLENEADRTLVFESRFESGNLKKAISTTENEYDLYLKNDYNSQGYGQWYYFKVSNTRKNTTYTFNIVNHFKPDSLYNQGMKPLAYSVKKAKYEGCGWFRIGQNVWYYPTGTKKKNGWGIYYSMSFSFEFEYDKDEVYFCHSYPYTYRDLKDFLKICNDKKADRVRRTELCKSLGGNSLDYIIITNFESPDGDIAKRESVIITGRVHPGETVSSFIVEGILEFLISDSDVAKQLRDTYVFKIVPMLNPDGVVLGNYRCSLSGQDLNRQWANATARLYPEIFYTKQMLNKTVGSRPINFFIDVHGHSRKKNIFMYGCHNKNTDKRNAEKIFPLVFSKTHSSFSFDDCNFNIQKDKESTGRVVVRKEYSVINSFTLEASFCGPNVGKYKDCHFTPTQLKEAGKAFCITLNNMEDKKIKVDLLKELQASIIPSDTQIENILKDFDQNVDSDCDDDGELDEDKQQKESDKQLMLSCKGKKFKPETRSYSNLGLLSLTHTAGMLNNKQDSFYVASKPHATAPFFRTKSFAPRSAWKM